MLHLEPLSGNQRPDRETAEKGKKRRQKKRRGSKRKKKKERDREIEKEKTERVTPSSHLHVAVTMLTTKEKKISNDYDLLFLHGAVNKNKGNV